MPALLFDVEFEGTLDDAINGLSPVATDATLEASISMFGNGCCLIGVGGGLVYTPPEGLKETMKINGWTVSCFSQYDHEFITPKGDILPAETNIHKAMVIEKDGDVYNMYSFIAGVLQTSVEGIAAEDIDTYINYSFMTYLWLSDDCRIDGLQILPTALWTAGFIPPTEPYESTSEGADVLFEDTDVGFQDEDILWNGQRLVSISMTPLNPILGYGQTQQFTVLGMFADGIQRDITSRCSFSSSNVGVATINSSGVATGGNL